MKGFVKWMDDAPIWMKVIFALPITGIVWAIYRIVKGAAYGKVGTLIAGILWIVVGTIAFWLIDLVCIIIWGRPKLFA